MSLSLVVVDCVKVDKWCEVQRLIIINYVDHCEYWALLIMMIDYLDVWPTIKMKNDTWYLKA